MTGTKEPAAHQEAFDSTQGWLIVGSGICALTMTWGAIFTFTVYADRLATTSNLTQLQVSSVLPTATAVFLMVSGLFGVLAARFSPRPVLVIVGAGLIAATVLLQIVNSYPGVAVVFSPPGITEGAAFTIIVPLTP